MALPRSLRALLDGLIDYAGLFPPARLDMQAAVANFARYRESARSHRAGRATNSSGPISVKVASRARAGKTQPINPMSW